MADGNGQERHLCRLQIVEWANSNDACLECATILSYVWEFLFWGFVFAWWWMPLNLLLTCMFYFVNDVRCYSAWDNEVGYFLC